MAHKVRLGDGVVNIIYALVTFEAALELGTGRALGSIISPLYGRSINACVAFRVTFINVLEQSRALLSVKRFVVSPGQTRIEHILNSEFELRAGTGFLPPVENEQLFDPGQ